MTGMLLYDGECRFCSTSALWLQRHVPGAAGVRPWQQADLAHLGVTAKECAEAVQWVGNGGRAAGPAALAAYLETSTGVWRASGRVLSHPAAQSMAEPLYRWLVPHPSNPLTDTVAQPPARPVGRGIRRRRERDLGACVRLLRLVHTEGRYPAYWPEVPRAWLTADEVLDAWVVERRGELVGHVAVCEVGRDRASALRWREITGRTLAELGAVSRLFVRPRARGEGIGSALLDVAVKEIRARGMLPVLEVVSNCQAAIALYEERGWRLAGIYDWGRRGDRLRVMYFIAPPA